VFSQSAISSPLLTEEEISQLIFAAPVSDLNKTKQLPQAGRSGEQLASVKGLGSDFAEVRAYHSGDDLRHIDWRATARSSIPLVRSYHSELSCPVCILIDRRASMRFATRRRLKVTQALRLALWLSGREIRAGGELSVVILDQTNHWLPAQRGMQTLRTLVDFANTPCPPIHDHSNESGWGKILAGLHQHCAKGSNLILISDFSALSEKNSTLLAKLGQHCSTRAIRIFDPIEMNAEFSFPLQLTWGRKNKQVKLSNSQESVQFKAEQQQWQTFLAEKLRKANIDYFELSVQQDDLSKVKQLNE
jgi:uncharacterized protein (DUF58 family)